MTPTPTEIESLLERVLSATGPSRALDVAIAEICTDWRVSRDPWWNWHEGPLYSPPGDEWCIRQDGRKDLPCDEALPTFTASIDAALALIERVLPGWKKHTWDAGIFGATGPSACLMEPDFAKLSRAGKPFSQHTAEAATPPFALIAAGLTALLHPSMETTNG